MTRALRTLIACASCVAIVACGGGRRPELDWPVDQPGLHHVGYQERHIKYVPDGQGETRDLRLAIWYPTGDTSGTPAKYYDSFEREDVFVSAKPIDGDGWPVAIFSHGHLSFAEQSWFVTEYLASHGFIVLAPDHTGNTLQNADEERPSSMFYLRPLDITAVLDALYALNEPDSLAGRASDKVLAFGHSYGGYTTLASSGGKYAVADGECTSSLCQGLDRSVRDRLARGVADPRIDAAAPMAAGDAQLFLPSGLAAIQIPVLLMTASKDQSVPNASEGDPYWASLDDPFDRRVDLPRGGHHSFSVTCEIVPSFGENDGCGEDFVDYREAQRIVDTYVLAFARLHLDDDTSMRGIIDGEVTVSSEAVVSRK